VRHKNVTIRNCRIGVSDYYAIFAPDDQGFDVSGLVVDHCTITGATNGVAGKGTVTRCDISKCENGVNAWGPILINECFIHNLGGGPSTGPHNDGIENNGSPMTVTNCRIVASPQNDTSAVMTNNEFGKLHDITISGNYLEGGQYTLYCDSSKSSANMPVTNFVVKNNTIKAGRYGATSLYNSGVVIDSSNHII
jgi:hypothetical protein